MAYEPVAGSLDFRDVAERLRRLDESLAAAPEALLEALVVAAHEQIPGASAVSITTLRRGRFVTDAASTPRALAADQLQYDLLSGPCLQAAVMEDLYNPHDLLHDQRWPQFGPQVAATLGIHSCLSYQLACDRHRSSLNIYGDQPGAFYQDALVTGLVFATHAVAVINRADAGDTIDNLEKALRSNREIGIAIGIIMAHRKITRDDAFTLLRVASQNSNRKLHDLAAEVADTGVLPTYTIRRQAPDAPRPFGNVHD